MFKSTSVSFGSLCRRHLAVSAAAVCLALVNACGPPRLPAEEELHAVLAADDQRGTEEALVILRSGLASPEASVRAAAVRALGRLEHVEFIAEIAALSQNEQDPVVRLAATHALAQAATIGAGDAALEPLSKILTNETAAAIRAAAATGLGRLRYAEPARVIEVEQLLLATMSAPSPTVAEGVARGLAALLRGHRDLQLQATTIALLSDLSAPQTGQLDPGEFGSVAATEALLSAGQLHGERLLRASASATAEVRRLAARAYADDAVTAADPLFDAALADESELVRLEALRALRAKAETETVCRRYHTALLDEWLAVRLAAIDALAACADGRQSLETIADGGWDEQGWQPAAHALAGLARVAPTQQGERIAAAATATPWQVRMYAANAAGETGDADMLRELAQDASPNVQHAALRGLQAHLGHEADDVYSGALTSADYQVVMVAANALAGSEGDHLAVLLDALDRITEEQRETSRDPRTALLRAAATLGASDRSQGQRLTPYLGDFDAIVATLAAEILREWSGDDVVADPRPLPAQPFPTLAQIREFGRTRAVLNMASGDRVTLAFFPLEAPTHTARFFRLARDGYFDGLTFHRVVYNFVLQGGSPGANEFMGDGPFTRDEITARSHRRGTVGTSTRGRDTGDGQIFINLVDNLRLDFNYTIFAEVVDGHAALDRVAEGAVIESITFESDA